MNLPPGRKPQPAAPPLPESAESVSAAEPTAPPGPGASPAAPGGEVPPELAGHTRYAAGQLGKALGELLTLTLPWTDRE